MTPAALTLVGRACEARPKKPRNALEQKRAGRFRSRQPIKNARSRSRLFHVKRKSGSTSSLICCCSGKNKSTSSPHPLFLCSGPATSPTRSSSLPLAPDAQGLGRLRIGRGLSRHPDRLRAGRQARYRWFIWLKALAKRPISCARRCAHRPAGAGPPGTGREIWGKLCRNRRCGDGARARPIENPVRSGVSFDRQGRGRPVPQGTRCSG